MTDGSREAQTRHRLPGQQEPAPEGDEPGSPTAPDDASAEQPVTAASADLPSAGPDDDRLQSKVSPGFASGGFAPQPVELQATAPAAPDAEDAAPLPAADDELEPEDEVPTIRDRLRRLSPAVVILTVASVGSALFLVLALTSHTTPVAALMSAGVVTALVFALDTVICSAATYRFSQTEEFGSALATALLGGISAVICAVAMAATLIMILVLNS